MTAEVMDKNEKFKIFHGDSKKIIESFPDNSIDCVITSPPYWLMREYHVESGNKGNIIGTEQSPEEYVRNLVNIFHEVKRVLKPSGSVWLNIGDKVFNKNLMGMPWRVALAMQSDGWILRNDVIWNKLKGTQSSKDRLRPVHEYIFHFVKNKTYFYDYKKILIKPGKKPSVINGSIISATGVSGKKYRELIEESKELTQREKENAVNALNETLMEMKNGKTVDFRMTIRGNQRVLHGDSKKLSGRAKELAEKGFYIIKISSEGFLPNDVWNIVPEDDWRTDDHCAVFPIELLEIPIKSTCPEKGILLDPFVGTGSAVVAALKLGRRGIGIDISKKYVKIAIDRIKKVQITLTNF
jgi:DNA modification methylase